MRLTSQQILAIRNLAGQVAGEKARVRVFGSRLDGAMRGGDLDLMIELNDPVANPALLAAQIRVVRKECIHLRTTDQRLFAGPFTPETASRLDMDPDLAERVEAFGSRNGRLQDTLADKLLPVLLRALGEKPGYALKTSVGGGKSGSCFDRLMLRQAQQNRIFWITQRVSFRSP